MPHTPRSSPSLTRTLFEQAAAESALPRRRVAVWRRGARGGSNTRKGSRDAPRATPAAEASLDTSSGGGGGAGGRPADATFELHALLLHSGQDVMRGHYQVIVRITPVVRTTPAVRTTPGATEAIEATEAARWLLFSDERSVEVPSALVASFCAGGVRSSDVYCLYYKKSGGGATGGAAGDAAGGAGEASLACTEPLPPLVRELVAREDVAWLKEAEHKESERRRVYSSLTQE